MTQEIIRLGAVPLAGKGESIHDAIAKINRNFDYLYSGKIGNNPENAWGGELLQISQTYEDSIPSQALVDFHMEATGILPPTKNYAFHATSAFINSDDATNINSAIYGAAEFQTQIDPENASTNSGSDGLGTGTSLIIGESRGIEHEAAYFSGDITKSAGYDERFRNGSDTAGTENHLRDHTSFSAHGLKGQGTYGYLYNYTGMHIDKGDVANPYLETGGFWIGTRLTAPGVSNFADGGNAAIGLWIDGTNNGGDIVFGTDKSASITVSNSFMSLASGTRALALPGTGAWEANGTAAVSLTALAPAGVTTATVTKWLKLRDDTGTIVYVPAWT